MTRGVRLLADSGLNSLAQPLICKDVAAADHRKANYQAGAGIAAFRPQHSRSSRGVFVVSGFSRIQVRLQPD